MNKLFKLIYISLLNLFDINSVIKFVQNIYVNDKIKQNSTVQLVSSEIRQFAEKNCSMEIAMEKVLDFFKE